MKTKITLLLLALVSISLASGQTPVSRVTIGLGMGGNHLFEDIYEYSLSTDGSHSLKIDKGSRNNLVLSPVIAFRLEKFDISAARTLTKSGGGVAGWDYLGRFSILVSANILDLKSGNTSFNRNIDGGFGVGYAFSPDIQIGVFYETQRFRQLRSYIAKTYDGLPIPNGVNEVYNALDVSDNNLFHDKTLQGISVKLIFNVTSL